MGFKVIKYDSEMREKHPNLYEMAKSNICFDEFMQPKESYLERVRQWNEQNGSIVGDRDSPIFTLHMSKKENIQEELKYRMKDQNKKLPKP